MSTLRFLLTLVQALELDCARGELAGRYIAVDVESAKWRQRSEMGLSADAYAYSQRLAAACTHLTGKQ